MANKHAKAKNPRKRAIVRWSQPWLSLPFALIWRSLVSARER